MAARRDDSLDIARFGDALRNFLGLEPIYQTMDRPNLRSVEAAEVARFYVDPFSDNPMTPRRGATP